MRYIVHYRQLPLYLPKSIYSVAQCSLAEAAVFVVFVMVLGSEKPCPTLRRAHTLDLYKPKVHTSTNFGLGYYYKICWKPFP